MGGDEGKMKMKEKLKMIVMEIILGIYHFNSIVKIVLKIVLYL